MKKCSRCKQEKEQAEFWGQKSFCIPCAKEYAKEYRNKPENKEKDRERRRLYKKTEKGRLQKYRYSHSPNGIAARKRHKAKYLQNNKPAKAAHNWIERRVKLGVILKQPCVVCGETETVAHHPCHAFVNEVVWLCRYHHNEYHLTKIPNYAESDIVVYPTVMTWANKTTKQISEPLSDIAPCG